MSWTSEDCFARALSNTNYTATAAVRAPDTRPALPPAPRGETPLSVSSPADDELARAIAASLECSVAAPLPRTTTVTDLKSVSISFATDSCYQKEIPCGPGGDIVLDGVKFVPVECGARAKGHNNMCFYLSVAGSETGALQLKADLAPVANHLASLLGEVVDHAAPSTMGSDWVAHAYAMEKKKPLIVVNVATSKKDGRKRWDVCSYGAELAASQAAGAVMLLCKDRHYQRLVPASACFCTATRTQPADLCAI